MYAHSRRAASSRSLLPFGCRPNDCEATERRAPDADPAFPAHGHGTPQFLSVFRRDLFQSLRHPSCRGRKALAMGNLSAGLNIALRSLLTEQGALQITSNNIANVNTPGYSRQRADFQ